VEKSNKILADAAALVYPGDGVMADLLHKVGVNRTMLELRAIILGFLAGFRNPQNTPDILYAAIRGGEDLLDRDPLLLGEYTKALIGLKNETARWDLTTEPEGLRAAAGEDPVVYLNRRVAEGELFHSLMLDGREENVARFREKTQKNLPALLQVLGQLQAIRDALESGEMPRCPEVMELLESYAREMCGIMIFLKSAEANELIERDHATLLPPG
jgi:hypothetical protein